MGEDQASGQGGGGQPTREGRGVDMTDNANGTRGPKETTAGATGEVGLGNDIKGHEAGKDKASDAGSAAVHGAEGTSGQSAPGGKDKG